MRRDPALTLLDNDCHRCALEHRLLRSLCERGFPAPEALWLDTRTDYYRAVIWGRLIIACAPEKTGKESAVRVRYVEGLAIHSGPESCAVSREGGSEALTGVRTGQVLSRERMIFPGADMVSNMESKTNGGAMRVPGRPGVVEDPGMCARSLHGNREILGLAGKVLLVRVGKVRSRSR